MSEQFSELLIRILDAPAPFLKRTTKSSIDDDRRKIVGDLAIRISMFSTMSEGDGQNDALASVAGSYARLIRNEADFFTTISAINQLFADPLPDSDVKAMV